MFVYCPPIEIPKIESQTFPDGKRYYVTPDGKKLPSVTTVVGAQKKQSILEWRRRSWRRNCKQNLQTKPHHVVPICTLCVNII